ncbi:MAG: 50S ribosomal protein L11 methyltransferase [Lachnospiraceae bacterium]|nr:50S ribosomal protein L11 methyltransferase [Lachnospiraceae bacterium]
MRWLKFRVETVEEAEDILISDLYDAGFEGAQIEDKQPLSALDKEKMFVDIPLDPGEDDGKAYLSFFVEAPEGEDERKALADQHKETIRKVLEDAKEFMDIGSGAVEVSETEDLDWINNWKKYFHSFYIDDILVIPSWEEVQPSDSDKMILHIDPGTAFGTGMHETTQLCIRQLKKYVTGESDLLDVGTGSGILGILSLMFGAKRVTGTDLDPCAVDAVADNLRQNGFEDSGNFKLILGNVIGDEQVCAEVLDSNGGKKFDIVTANILADVLIPLTPYVTKMIKKDGIFITSGIIEGREDSVAETMKANGFEVVNIGTQGEWRSVTGIYRG